MLRLLTALTLFVAAPLAQQSPDTPEAAIVALLKAIYSNDANAYNAATIPDARRARLTTGGKLNPAKLRQLEEDPGSVQMRRRRPFLFRGREASPDTNGRYAVGTTALYTAAHGGGPMVVMLVRQADGWKVDVRWWLAMMELQTTPPKPGTPEFAARALTLSVAAMDRKAAAEYAMPGSSLDLLFLGGQREPSGHLEALAMEMPLVELQPGEFYPLGDRVVEGSASADVKVLLGLFGSVEIPFVFRRSGSEWRVEPQSFFRYFNR